MRPNAEERLKSNLEHARWRVSFLLNLLASHRALPRMSLKWEMTEADYIQRLAFSQIELARLERL
jgi:hypothetical protein